VMAGVCRPSAGALSVDLTGGQGRPVFLPYHGNYDGFLKVSEFLDCWGNKTYMEREIDAWQLEKLLGQRISRLSVGQFKRVLLASCLSQASSLFLLVEPTTGLDEHFLPILQDQLRQRMELGTMVMVATHQPETFVGTQWKNLLLEVSA
jgi:ABC-type Mn2+/Zn2+ transport system ATPase subunit